MWTQTWTSLQLHMIYVCKNLTGENWHVLIDEEFSSSGSKNQRKIKEYGYKYIVCYTSFKYNIHIHQDQKKLRASLKQYIYVVSLFV